MPHVSFIMPAYNCAGTIAESVASIMETNFRQGDELVIVNDFSSDGTASVIESLQEVYPVIKAVHHPRNRGGGSARNTAVEHASHPLLFCLDSDNILAPGCIERLASFLTGSGLDSASFKEVRYFVDGIDEVTHTWVYCDDPITLADTVAGPIFPGTSGNYMFTRKSWSLAGGYPEFAGALDTWGFAVRQLATGTRMAAMPDSHYWHRYGYESYYVRESTSRNLSLQATQVLLPFHDLIQDRDLDYLLSRAARFTWFDAITRRPIRTKADGRGRNGTVVSAKDAHVQPAAGGGLVEGFLRLLGK